MYQGIKRFRLKISSTVYLRCKDKQTLPLSSATIVISCLQQVCRHVQCPISLYLLIGQGVCLCSRCRYTFINVATGSWIAKQAWITATMHGRISLSLRFAVCAIIVHGMIRIANVRQIILRISYQMCWKVRESKLIKPNTRMFHLDCGNECKVERINNKAGLQLKNLSYIPT